MGDDDNEACDRDIAKLKQHAIGLMEHFDTVQIFATRYEPDGRTLAVQHGKEDKGD